VRDAVFTKYYKIEEWEKSYKTCTGELKAIADYTGLSIDDILKLPISLFLLYRKEAWIYNQNSSEEGRKMMKDFWRLQQTKADLQAVHEFQNRGDS
jgi:hypothetical protein